MIPLAWYLTFAAALFCLGLYAVLARQNAVAILMGIELMLNAVIVNLIAFWRYNEPENVSGQAFAIIVFAVAAAEAAVALAIVLNIYRNHHTVTVDRMDSLSG